MMDVLSSPPVAIIIYNRQDKVLELLKVLERVQPRQLFIIADGPKNEQDRQLCLQTREVIEGIHWTCDIKKIYSDINLGCGVRPYTGITECFKFVDKLVVLEDDCLPLDDFFTFTKHLLDQYEKDENVMMISGNDNFQGRYPADGSYTFTRFTQTHGWATWKRAWLTYDFTMQDWLQFRESNKFKKLFSHPYHRRFWRMTFDHYAGGKKDVWDYQWSYSLFKHEGLCIVPNGNLVMHTGIGEMSTHYKGGASQLENQTLNTMSFPLRHPAKIKTNIHLDRLIQEEVHQGGSLFKKIIRRLISLNIIGRSNFLVPR